MVSKMKNSTVFIIMMLLLVIPSYTEDKEDYSEFHWTINLEGAIYSLSEHNGWGFGPGLKITFDLSSTFGIQVGAFGLPTSSGGYSFRGLALDGGIRYRPSIKRRQFAFEAGFSHIFGNDSDGSQLNAIGVHAGASVISWLGKHIGLCGHGIFRYWFRNENFKHSHMYGLSPSLSGGIALRF
jgi:hypothetical protein